MKITITGHETVLTPELKKYIEKKFNKLCKTYKQILSAEVIVEEGAKKTAKKIATAKATIKVAGPDVTAEATERTIFAAVDELERKLMRQLEKIKSTHDPKKSRFLRGKNILRKILKRESQQ